MQQNMGTTDRLVRAVLVAPALLVLAFVVGFGSVLGVVAVVLAVVMLGTAAVGFCPLYLPFHLHTDRGPKAPV
jgi:uncharacterized membrane protein